jgi:hypothetical protein
LLGEWTTVKSPIMKSFQYVFGASVLTGIIVEVEDGLVDVRLG